MRRQWVFGVDSSDGGARFVLRSDMARGEKSAPEDAALSRLLASIGARFDRDGSGRRAAVEMLSACGLAPFDLARADRERLLAQLRSLVKQGGMVMLAVDAPARARGRGGTSESTETPPPEPKPKPAPRPTPERKPKEVVSLKSSTLEAWCSEDVTADGTTENYSNDESIEVKFQQQGGPQTRSVAAQVAGNGFAAHWTIKDILPASRGGHLAPDLKMDAQADSQASPKPLTIKFVTHLDKVHHVQDRTHFDLSLTDDVVLVESDIKYVQGWGAQVVKLGNKVPPGTGGVLDGQLAWPGYRWMKNVGLEKRFWDGAAWQSLPAGFVLADSNNFCVGFYQQGASFVSQYGGSWPESFSAWNIGAPDKQSTIPGWTNNIRTTWTGKFDLKRKECKSKERKCCRYSTKASVSFSKQAAFAAGMLIIADGNIRSNDSLLFLGEPRIAVAAHEFGHHLGNPDEYAGAAVDAALNSDGAAKGIDADSIMGQNLTKVKARHFREIAKAFTNAVAGVFGKAYSYLVVPP